MKKMVLLALAVLALVAGCQKGVDLVGVASCEVTFNVGLSGELTSRSSEITPARYIVELYSGGDLSQTPLRVEQESSSFTLTLENGSDYTMLFYADEYSDNTIYNAQSLQALSIASQPDKSCYSAAVSFTCDADATTKSYLTPILTNSVAQVSFNQTSNEFTTDDNTLNVTFSDSYSYNIADGSVTTLSTSQNYTFSNIAQNSADTTIAICYIFADKTAQTVVDVEFALNDEQSQSVATVPFQCNYRTNVSGSFSSKLYEAFSVSVSSGWNTEANEMPLSPEQIVGLLGVTISNITSSTFDITFDVTSDNIVVGYAIELASHEGYTIEDFASGDYCAALIANVCMFHTAPISINSSNITPNTTYKIYASAYINQIYQEVKVAEFTTLPEED